VAKTQGSVRKISATYPKHLKTNTNYATVWTGGYNISYSGSGVSFTGASAKSTLQNWTTSSGDANADLLPSLPLLRERCRDLVRNTPIGAGIIKTIVRGVIGSGLKVKPAIDADALGMSREQEHEWENKARREFNLWAESPLCDYYGKHNFYALQRMAFESMLVNGDCFILLHYVKTPGMPYDLRLQLIEADRVSNPDYIPDSDTIAGGIGYDEKGRPTTIYIRNTHPGSSVTTTPVRWIPVPIYGAKTGRLNVLHIQDITRIGQSRGLPILAPVVESIRQSGQYVVAEGAAATLNSSAPIVIERNPPADLAGSFEYCEENEKGEIVENSEPWKRKDNYTDVMQIGTATWIDLPPYEKATMLSAVRPSGQFEPFINSNLKLQGMGVDVPGEVIAKSYNASYSASRASMNDAQSSYNVMRNSFNYCCNQPIYEAIQVEGIVKNRIQADGYMLDPGVKKCYTGAYWLAPRLESIDPVKDAKAAEMRIKSRTSSTQWECENLTGMELSDIYKDIDEENMLCQKYGVPLRSNGNPENPNTDKEEEDGDGNGEGNGDSDE